MQNKRKYGTITYPYRYTEYSDPARDATKTDYYDSGEETVRQRELARQQKKAEKRDLMEKNLTVISYKSYFVSKTPGGGYLTRGSYLSFCSTSLQPSRGENTT